MSKQQFFTELRDILVYLYPEETDARRIVNDAGVDAGNISFSAKAINNWTAILLQAQKENKTANLMAATFRDYKENEKLSKGWHDYLVTVSQREVIPSPHLMSSRAVRWPLVWVGLVVVIFLIIGILLREFPSIVGDLLSTGKAISNDTEAQTFTASAMGTPTSHFTSTALANITASTTESMSVTAPSVLTEGKWEGTFIEGGAAVTMIMNVKQVSLPNFFGEVHYPKSNAIMNIKGKVLSKINDTVEQSKWSFVEGYDPNVEQTLLFFEYNGQVQGPQLVSTVTFRAIGDEKGGIISGVWFYSPTAAQAGQSFTLFRK